MSISASLRPMASVLFLSAIVSGCQATAGAYRSTAALPATGAATRAGAAGEPLAIRMTVHGVTQVRWVQAARVEDVLNSVPGIVALPLGTDDLTLRLWGKERPTVMIDGVHALPGDLLLLYPWEIGAVEVLRDVPSTAVYGELGRNGIIRVTTRRTR